MNFGKRVEGAATMGITGITINAVEPFADGKPFGDAGPYVRIKGVARGALDPLAPENAGIVDLDKAPRSAAGRVEYPTDAFIRRPAEPRRGGRLPGSAAPTRG